MSKEILGHYGPDRTEDGKRATNGGRQEPKELPYNPPQGPKHQYQPGPGLRGGTNHGCCGTQGKH